MAILPDTKRVVILNAGHWDTKDTPHIDDPGASYNGVIEAMEVMKIRDRVIPILERHGITVHSVPDHINLPESITWANERAPQLNDGLAVDIHLNWLSNRTVRGSEAFYGVTDTSWQIAAAITKNVSKEMGIPDRGAKTDTQTAVGQLGWIRQSTMWATLIEVCFLTNQDDMDALHAPGGYDRAATGIAKGILEVFGVPYVEPEPLGDLYISDADGNRIYKIVTI